MRKIILLAVATVVLSVVGIALTIMGVHGAGILSIAAIVLLLPNFILLWLGVPLGIPLLTSTKLSTFFLFAALQAGYFYGLLQLIYLAARYHRRRSVED